MSPYMYERLIDGTVMVVRPVRSQDKPMLSAAPKRSDSHLHCLTELDGHDNVAYVALPLDQPDRVVGVGRWVRLSRDSESAEAAVVVAQDWQRRGVGSLLSAALASSACSRGVRRFTADIPAENSSARRLMSKLGGRVEPLQGGAVKELVAELAA